MKQREGWRMLNTFKKFFIFCGNENKKKFYLSIILGIVKALGQALQIPAIYIIVRGMTEGKLTSGMILLAFSILIVGILLQIALGGKSSMLQTEGGYTACANKRIEIANHLRYLPMGYFNNNSLGYITSVTTNTMEGLADIATRVVMITLQGAIEAGLLVLFLYFFDWRIGIVATSGMVLFFGVNHITQKCSSAMAPQKVKADTGMVEQVLEFIQGITEARNYNMTIESNRKLEDAIDEAEKTCIDMELKFVPILGVQAWLIKMTGVAMCVLSLKLCFEGSLNMSECIVMMIASFIVFASLESASKFSALLRTVELSVDKANEILEIEEMDIRGENIQPNSYDINMKDVDFAYNKRKIVDNVSLKIPEYNSVAFVGPSGGGKTTICHLIARFWDVQSGTIELDGINVKRYSMDALMQNYSFVFQNVYLFHDTIANNIRFSQPHASIEKVKEAAKKACCDEFIRALPNGYDTIVGEGGASLSGGEKQRISIARAIMKDAPIIVLDEATANVDPENEKELMEAIQSLTKEKTVLMIAHRLKTVRYADQIFVIDKGKIVQQGKHEELMQEEGIYRNFISEREQAVSWRL